MDMQVLQLVVPSLLTVIGWLIAAWWAIEQVNTAHEKNAQLQSELLNESHRRDIARELIEIYKSVAQCGNNLRQAMSSFWLNHMLEKSEQVEGVSFNASTLVGPVNDAYNKMAQEITRLEMWMKVAGEHLPNSELLSEAISEFHNAFSFGGDENPEKGKLWTSYQAFLAAYQSKLDVSETRLSDLSKALQGAIGEVIAKMADGTAQINRELCGA